jgi:hypothetical protein
MVWFVFVAVAAVLLIGAYSIVRLRSHETDAVPEDPGRPSTPRTGDAP